MNLLTDMTDDRSPCFEILGSKNCLLISSQLSDIPMLLLCDILGRMFTWYIEDNGTRPDV